MADDMVYGALILGRMRLDVSLTVDTRVAYVESFDMSEAMASFKPREYRGTVPIAGEVDDHVEIVDGWRLNKFIHNAVHEAHGPLVWGYSDTMRRCVAGIDVPVLWAWDEQKRLVCIAAPIAKDGAFDRS